MKFHFVAVVFVEHYYVLFLIDWGKIETYYTKQKAYENKQYITIILI